jgi:hypothetical protein
MSWHFYDDRILQEVTCELVGSHDSFRRARQVVRDDLEVRPIARLLYRSARGRSELFLLDFRNFSKWHEFKFTAILLQC